MGSTSRIITGCRLPVSYVYLKNMACNLLGVKTLIAQLDIESCVPGAQRRIPILYRLSVLLPLTRDDTFIVKKI